MSTCFKLHSRECMRRGINAGDSKCARARNLSAARAGNAARGKIRVVRRVHVGEVKAIGECCFAVVVHALQPAAAAFCGARVRFSLQRRRRRQPQWQKVEKHSKALEKQSKAGEAHTCSTCHTNKIMMNPEINTGIQL